MHTTPTKYHKVLAEYYFTKQLYLDSFEKTKAEPDSQSGQHWMIEAMHRLIPSSSTSEEKKIPDFRKLAEQPYQQARAMMLDEAVETLTDIDFIEAKLMAGMTYLLIEDYTILQDLLPENKSKSEELLHQKELISSWIQKLINYSANCNQINSFNKSQAVSNSQMPVLPELPPKVRLLSPEEIDNESFRIIARRDRTDRLNAFQHLVVSNYFQLNKFHKRKKFLLMLALNSEPEGFLYEAASKKLKMLSGPFLSRVWPENEHSIPFPVLLKTIETEGGFAVQCFRISPDGKYAVAGYFHGDVRLWDLETGLCLKVVKVKVVSDPNKIFPNMSALEQSTLRKMNSAGSIAVTPDMRLVLTGNDDRSLQLWDMKTGKCLHVMEGHTDTVTCVSMTPDGSKAISASKDNTLKVWDLNSGICQRSFTDRHMAPVYRLAITADGMRAVSAAANLTVHLWNIDTEACMHSLKDRIFYHISWDGAKIVVADLNGLLHEWDMNSFELLGSKNWNFDLRNARGENVITDSLITIKTIEGKKLLVYDTESGRLIRTFKGHSGNVTDLNITVDEKYVVSGSMDGTLKVWNLENGKSQDDTLKHDSIINCLSLTPDGLFAVTGSEDKSLKIWDLKTCKCLRTMEGHSDSILSLCLSPDGKTAISGSRDSTLRVWDIDTGTCKRVMTGHTGPVNCTGISSDGVHIFSYSNKENALRSWNIASGLCETNLPLRADGGIECMRMIPYSNRLIFGFGDGKILDFNVKTKEVRDVSGYAEGHEGMISSLSITPDGKLALTGGQDCYVRLWDLNDMNDRLYVKLLSYVSGNDITPDGRFAVIACWDQTLILWDIKKWEMLSMYLAPSPLSAVAISPSGETIVCGTWSGEFIVLKINNFKST